MGAKESTPRTLVLDNPNPTEVETVHITSAVSQAASTSQQDARGDYTYSNERPFGARPTTGLDEYISYVQSRYEDQIRSMELKNEALFRTRLLQFTDAIQRVEKKYLQSTAPVVCANEQNAVLKCYADHKGETLKCVQDVRAFNECTRKYHTMLKAH